MKDISTGISTGINTRINTGKNGVSTGIPGMGQVAPGTHMCALYSGSSERDGLLLPFIREGLRAGDHCLCYVNDPQLGPLRDLATEPVPAGPSLPARLDVRHSSDVYLDQGRFSLDHMVTTLADQLEPALEGRFPVLRAAGEMPWPGIAPQPGRATEFFAYESAINDLVEEQPALFMCMYDVHRFGIAMLIAVLKTHPTVLLDQSVIANANYVAAEEYLAAGAVVDPVDGAFVNTVDGAASAESGTETEPERWSSLTAHEMRISDLVATGLTNRSIAGELHLSPHTIDAHLKRIYNKLGVHSRVQLTVLALQAGRGAAEPPARPTV